MRPLGSEGLCQVNVNVVDDMLIKEANPTPIGAIKQTDNKQ